MTDGDANGLPHRMQRNGSSSFNTTRFFAASAKLRHGERVIAFSGQVLRQSPHCTQALSRNVSRGRSGSSSIRTRRSRRSCTVAPTTSISCPLARQVETYGSRATSNRSLQWGEKIIEPVFELKPDQEILYLFARKFGFEKELCKNIKVNGNEPFIEDVTREFNRGMWTIGYTGQSPECLRKHMQYQHTFDNTTLQAIGGPCGGECYSLPWPCVGERRKWGTPVRPTSTIPRSRWRKADCASGPTSGWSATAKICPPKAPTQRARS
jgi:hypothetical protein